MVIVRQVSKLEILEDEVGVVDGESTLLQPRSLARRVPITRRLNSSSVSVSYISDTQPGLGGALPSVVGCPRYDINGFWVHGDSRRSHAIECRIRSPE
ncbi:hypothetical protein C8034_v005440 [Colletotrichum sidae]|uniref:Uncharacterized protein n=1 Tax=Colletotrichum sidae TaxID=1347389 RepID=A0A4R8TUH6_9PEZI|nr:hypothetical protein C8034_v005440 [Colletotrichum sidae]